MLFEYYTIRLKDAEPGKGLLHTTQHYDEIHSSIKHFKEKHPGKEVVAYKHEIKKGPLGATFKRKAMFGKSKINEVWGAPAAVGYLATKNRTTQSAQPTHSIRQGDKVKTSDGKIGHADFVNGEDVHVSGTNPYYPKHKEFHQGSTLTKVTEARMPLADHPYHTKTDAELKYIIKDAGQAAKAQKGMSSEGKYLDQVNDASTVLHYRKSKGLSEGTKSFKTLMRSIEDKKSIKSLKVPSPSERNPDGSMKVKEEPKKIEEAAQITNRHKVLVSVTDPLHDKVSHRKIMILKKVKVTATGRDEAKTKAELFYKNQGYKVHDVEYHSLIKEPTHVQQGAKIPRGYEMTAHGRVVKKNPGSKERRLGEGFNAGKPDNTTSEIVHKEGDFEVHELTHHRKFGAPSKEHHIYKAGKKIHKIINNDVASSKMFIRDVKAGKYSKDKYGKTHWLKIDESSSPFTHMVHVQGNFENPQLEKHLHRWDGDYHQETDKGSLYKFKSEQDATGFSKNLKHYAKDLYAGDVTRLNSTR